MIDDKPSSGKSWRRRRNFLLLLFCRPEAARSFFIRSNPGNRPHEKSSQKSLFGQKDGETSASLTTIRTLPRPINPSEDTGKVSVSKEGHSGFLSIDQLVELKESIDIVSAIESYGLEKFHKRDAFHATACCPFHSDQSPSLSIDGTRRIFKCFGCGVGGDIFRFVREYSKLEGQEEMSFYRAVRYVSEHFADGSLQSLPSAASKRTPRIMTDEEREQLHHRKERILLANAAAAAFYVENLKKPFAGGARYYLLSRGLTAATVRAFGIGFALDAYFDGPSSAKKTWGEGSLVHHLRDLGFSPEEIMDAGLAIQRKKSAKEDRAREIDERVRETANNTMQEEVDYSSLMDRFRNRLMVPILDGSGKNVLGFGGRIIPSPDESDNQNIEYKPAKYLNSPESVVFEKKRITFGQHLAREAILKEMRQSQSSQTPPIVLVEGYMDAIALSTAGITAVASMGTALSSEQLALAARIAGSPGSRIVLCFDNDEAGVASIERLCTNGMLSDITAKHSADVLVGRLPGGTKDPADFVQSRTFSGAKASKVREDFLAEVVNCASSWSDWFIERLLAGYDPDSQRGSKGSFSDIFSRVADFIATTAGPADRTKRACEVAGKLSDVLARDLNTTEVSKAVQIQLESDLLDLASRLAYAKEEIDRRTEGPGAVLSSLSRGHGPNSADGSGDKLSIKALAAVATGNRTSISRKKSFHPRRTRRKTAARRSRIMTRKRPESLTPHFAGFRFAHERDAEWLGLQKGKWGKRNYKNLVLGDVISSVAAERRVTKGIALVEQPTRVQENVVYFNSADYHGHQFLTEDAMEAGYTRVNVKRDPSLIEKGIASLVEQDVKSMKTLAEDSLLRVLVRHSPSRTIVKNILEARNAVSPGIEIGWSCPKKEWLFNFLVLRADEIPSEMRESSELRRFLAEQNATDALDFLRARGSPDPESEDLHVLSRVVRENDSVCSNNTLSDGSFPRRNGVQIQENGRNNTFFEDSISDDLRTELALQELLATLLWTSTAIQTHLISRELAALSARRAVITEEHERNETLHLENSGLISETVDHNGNSEVKSELILSELDTQQIELLGKLRVKSHALQSLKESARNLSFRLLDRSTTRGIEGHMSAALQADLAARLDEHLEELSQLNLVPEEGRDDENDEPYEDALERMAEELGEWFDDDYVWSPGDAAANSRSVSFSLLNDEDSIEDERETLEETLVRIEREWGGEDP